MKRFGIDNELINIAKKIESNPFLKNEFSKIDSIAEKNQFKIISAFQEVGIRTSDFAFETGYALFDQGRERTEKVFANIFGAEEAIVRTGFTSGTHAIGVMLLGLLKAGDELIYATGTPYDSIHGVIGLNDSKEKKPGSLKSFGVNYSEIQMNDEGIDTSEVLKKISEKTRVIMLQRAVGYAKRKALPISEIKGIVKKIRSSKFGKKIIIACDNCYGEFLDEEEPLEVGVDIMAGSLIKNPGGGIARTGAYIAGKKNLIRKVSQRFTVPGIGAEQGVNFGENRNMLQGLYFAPGVVASALKGALFCGELFSALGYETLPKLGAPRSDIIQMILLGSREKVIAFCEGVQNAGLIDSAFLPVPEKQPGYKDEIIMASGSFIQGSSIELSADAPLREPYAVYFQGGLTYTQAKLGALLAAKFVQKLKC